MMGLIGFIEWSLLACWTQDYILHSLIEFFVALALICSLVLEYTCMLLLILAFHFCSLLSQQNETIVSRSIQPLIYFLIVQSVIEGYHYFVNLSIYIFYFEFHFNMNTSTI